MLEDGVGADRSWNEGLQKGMKTLGGDGYVHYLDCGDGFMICTYVRTSSCASHRISVIF